MGNRRTFGRRGEATRELRKIFIIGVEGETEKAYFDAITVSSRRVKTYVIQGKGPQPPAIRDTVQSKIDSLIAEEELRSTDEAWLVFDRDDGLKDADVDEAFRWAAGHKNRYVGVTQPDFEYWLLLHFEDATGLSSGKECRVRLERQIPGYKKGDKRQLDFGRAAIESAIARANRKVPTALTCLEDLENIAGNFSSVHFLAKRLCEAGLVPAAIPATRGAGW